MRWTRRKHEAVPVAPVAAGWHEGAHWVAGSGAVVHAPRASDAAAGEDAPAVAGAAAQAA